MIMLINLARKYVFKKLIIVLVRQSGVILFVKRPPKHFVELRSFIPVKVNARKVLVNFYGNFFF